MERALKDLCSVGKATLKDFEVLGIKTVKQLVTQDATDLYERLCKITKLTHDPCCLDVFRAAIEQAKNPNLAKEKCQWWYWSRKRKLENDIKKRKI